MLAVSQKQDTLNQWIQWTEGKILIWKVEEKTFCEVGQLKRFPVSFQNPQWAAFSDHFDFFSLKLFTLVRPGGFFHYNRIFLIFLATKPEPRAFFPLLLWPFITTTNNWAFAFSQYQFHTGSSRYPSLVYNLRRGQIPPCIMRRKCCWII